MAAKPLYGREISQYIPENLDISRCIKNQWSLHTRHMGVYTAFPLRPPGGGGQGEVGRLAAPHDFSEAALALGLPP